MTYTTNLSRTSGTAALPRAKPVETAEYILRKEIVDEFLSELSGLSLKVMQEDLAQSMSGLQNQLKHASSGVYASDVKAKAQQALRSPKIEALQATICLKKQLDAAGEAQREGIIANFKKTPEYLIVVDKIFELNSYI